MEIYRAELDDVQLPAKRGQINKTVKKIQEWLVFNGFNPNGIDSEYGGGCEKAVSNFQRKSGINETGEVDKQTWDKLSKDLKYAIEFKPESRVLGPAIVEVARAHLKVHPLEVGGDNRGPWVRHYCKGADGAEYAWCQGFASSVVVQACVNLNIPSPIPLHDDTGYMSLYVPWVASSSKSVNRFSTSLVGVSPGSFFFVRGSTRYTHVGIVTELIGYDKFKTIEGNTNDEGSANGYEVCARIRHASTCDFGVI